MLRTLLISPGDLSTSSDESTDQQVVIGKGKKRRKLEKEASEGRKRSAKIQSGMIYFVYNGWIQTECPNASIIQ